VDGDAARTLISELRGENPEHGDQYSQQGDAHGASDLHQDVLQVVEAALQVLEKAVHFLSNGAELFFRPKACRPAGRSGSLAWPLMSSLDAGADRYKWIALSNTTLAVLLATRFEVPGFDTAGLPVGSGPVAVVPAAP